MTSLPKLFNSWVMIKYLKYFATFSSTKRTLKNHISFEPGLTVIRGDNEAGKSFIFEMIRYALFGTRALRGDRGDYDVLEVELDILIKEKPYKIVRKGIQASVNGTEAVGTVATNDFLESALGFGLSVFDICSNAQQGELDALTNDMRPTQRREVIDQVIGLSRFEEVEKDLRAESNDYKRLVEALEKQIIEIDEPIKPEGFVDPKELRAQLEQEIRNEEKRKALKEVRPPLFPAEPQLPPLEDLLEQQELYKQYHSLKNDYERKLSSLEDSEPEYTSEQLNKLSEALRQRALGSRPVGYSADDLDQWETTHHKIKNCPPALNCPECGYLIEGEIPPKPPSVSLEAIREERQRQTKWEGHSYDPDLPEPTLTQEQITKHQKAIMDSPQRQLLTQQLEELGEAPKDVEKEISLWQEYHAGLAQSEADQKRYQEYLEKRAEVDSLPPPQPDLRERLRLFEAYETDMIHYNSVMESQKTLREQIDKNSKDQSDHLNASKAVQAMRGKIKRYIIPALAQVSSNLLAQMTSGERSKIEITNDFEIYVDNQHVRTLSGSGISVVNLALRVALGQVLTRRVLPIFLADEIDANMASGRTQATHSSLKKLAETLSQVIVISHKEMEGDHLICV